MLKNRTRSKNQRKRRAASRGNWAAVVRYHAEQERSIREAKRRAAEETSKVNRRKADWLAQTARRIEFAQPN